MTVDEYAKILRHGQLELIEDGYYKNKAGQTGYKATYKDERGFYYWYSVSSTDVSFAPDEVALAITHQRRNILRQNPYKNRDDGKGFEATVASKQHCFMLNAAPNIS